jgi:predicted PurR-regulated permease PerM
MSEKIEHSVSIRSLFIVLAFMVSVFLVWRLSDIFLELLTSAMLAAALNPGVAVLNKKLPRALSAVIIVAGLLLPIIGILISVIPNLARELPNILSALTNGLRNAPYVPDAVRNFDISQYYASSGSYLLQSTPAIAVFFTRLITLIFLTLYLLIDADRLKSLAASLLPKNEHARLDTVAKIFTDISGQYIRRNLFISLVCSILIFIGLVSLGIPFAAPLALFAGIMDLLPLVGAIIGAAPAVILGFVASPLTGFLTVALFVVYQQFENGILAPNIYNKALHLTPTLCLLAVLIGSSLFGIAGAFLALPATASIAALIRHRQGGTAE